MNAPATRLFKALLALSSLTMSHGTDAQDAPGTPFELQLQDFKSTFGSPAIVSSRILAVVQDESAALVHDFPAQGRLWIEQPGRLDGRAFIFPGGNAMNRIFTAFSIRILALLASAGWCAWVPATAEAPLADVTGVNKIEIREVNSSTGAAGIQVEFDLQGAANASVVQATLRDFSLDTVLLLPQSNTGSFELKNHQRLLKQLIFTTPITPQMAPLLKKFGQHVRVSGTLRLTGQVHGTLFGKKPVTADSVFTGDALMVSPDEQVRTSITKLPYFAGMATADAVGVKPAIYDSPAAETWMPEMAKRSAANVVIIEASAEAGLGLVRSRLYRQGYRINDLEIVAPIDLADPLAAHRRKDENVLGDRAVNVSRKLNAGEVQYRAWMGGTSGRAVDRVSFELPASPLRLRCRLALDGGTNFGLGLFEFAGADKSHWESIDVDKLPQASISAIGLAYTGLSDSEPFTTAILVSTPLAGLRSGPSLALGSRIAAPAYGSPLFTQRGLAGIVNGPDSAVPAAELKRAVLNPACATPAPSSSPSPVERASSDLVKLKVVSNPDGSLVWIDHQLATDSSYRPVMTAASKAACTGANTAMVARGKHYVSFVREGYRAVSGYVQVDDDMTLTATLVRQR
jgi:hypothetical protein